MTLSRSSGGASWHNAPFWLIHEPKGGMAQLKEHYEHIASEREIWQGGDLSCCPSKFGWGMG